MCAARISSGGVAIPETRERRDARANETAGNDQIERVEIGRDVESEAVNRDARSDMHPEGTQLFVICPQAGRVAPELCRDAQLGDDPPDGPRHRGHVIDHAAAEPHHRVADQLAGSVVGDVTTSRRLLDRHAAPGELRRGGQDVRGQRGAAAGDDRVVLAEEQRLRSLAGQNRRAQAFLQRGGLPERRAPQPTPDGVQRALP